MAGVVLLSSHMGCTGLRDRSCSSLGSTGVTLRVCCPISSERYRPRLHGVCKALQERLFSGEALQPVGRVLMNIDNHLI